MSSKVKFFKSADQMPANSVMSDKLKALGLVERKPRRKSSRKSGRRGSILVSERVTDKAIRFSEVDRADLEARLLKIGYVLAEDVSTIDI